MTWQPSVHARPGAQREAAFTPWSSRGCARSLPPNSALFACAATWTAPPTSWAWPGWAECRTAWAWGESEDLTRPSEKTEPRRSILEQGIGVVRQRRIRPRVHPSGPSESRPRERAGAGCEEISYAPEEGLVP